MFQSVLHCQQLVLVGVVLWQKEVSRIQLYPNLFVESLDIICSLQKTWKNILFYAIAKTRNSISSRKCDVCALQQITTAVTVTKSTVVNINAAIIELHRDRRWMKTKIYVWDHEKYVKLRKFYSFTFSFLRNWKRPPVLNFSGGTPQYSPQNTSVLLEPLLHTI